MTDLTEVLAAATQLVSGYGLTREEFIAFLITPADGGTDGDGWLSFTRPDGTAAPMPSLAKMLALTSGTRGLVRQSYAEFVDMLPDLEVGTTLTVDSADTGVHDEAGVEVPNAGYYEVVQIGEDPKFLKRTGNLLTADLSATLDKAIRWATLESGEPDPDNYPGKLSAYQERILAESAAALSIATAAALNNAVVDAFPMDRYETPFAVRIEDVNTTTDLVTVSASGLVTIANGGRLLVTPTIASLGLAVGETARVAFERSAGTDTIPSFTFRNGSTLVSTINFTQVGNLFIGEAVIPASTTAIWIDRTNGSGSSAVITLPRIAKKRASGAMPDAQRARLNAIAADAGDMTNLWLSTTAAILATGSGSPTVNADGSVNVPGGAFVEIRSPNLPTPLAVGAPFTVLAEVSSPLNRQGDVRFTGELGGGASTAIPLRLVFEEKTGRWFLYLSGIVPTLPNSSTTAVSMVVRVDNRAPLETGLYTPAGLTASKFQLLAGTQLPARLLAAGAVPLATQITSQVESTGGKLFGVSLGDRFSEVRISRGLLGGALNDGAYGVRVPSGSSGQSSNILPRWTFLGRDHVGKVIQLPYEFTQTTPYTRTFGTALQIVNAAGTAITRSATVTSTVVGTKRTVTYEYTLQGDEVELWPILTFSSASNAAVDETITLTAFAPRFKTATNTLLNGPDANIDFMLRNGPGVSLAVGYGRVPALTRTRSFTVAPSGGNYISVIAAIAALAPVGVADRTKLMLAPGVHTTAEIATADYIDIQGPNARDCIIDGSLPNNASSADISAKSAVDVRRAVRFEGVTLRMKNGRYGAHVDSYGNLPNRSIEFHACNVEHLGNADATNGNAWTARFALGAGLSSGCSIITRGTRFYSKDSGAFSYHTNGLFSDPTLVDLEGCQFECDSTAAGIFAVAVLSNGSLQSDQCRLVGNDFGGSDITYTPSTWFPTALIHQPANHAEIQVYGEGNTPAVFNNTDWGRALRIDSATTGASSSVAVTGSAVKAIFGDGTNDRFVTLLGSVGFKGAVYGWGDISTKQVGPGNDVLTKTLGQRLGDCTGTSKVLNVIIDGGSPVTITFNANYTADSNATIIAIINAALGSAAVASEFAPGELYRPFFSDEERKMVNTGGGGIPKGSALAFNGDHRAVRLMTSADPAGLFAGVAWENIPVGRRGRVKRGGYLPIGDVLRTDGAAFAFGDGFSIDAGTPGRVFKGGSQGLLIGIRSDAVRLA